MKIFIFCFLIFISACISRSAAPEAIKSSAKTDSLIWGSYEDTAVPAGPIKLYFKVNWIKYQGKKWHLNWDTLFPVNMETGTIPIGEGFGIRVFHTTALEYGRNIHMVRLDYLILKDGKWRIITNTGYERCYFTLITEMSTIQGCLLSSWAGSHTKFKINYDYGARRL